MVFSSFESMPILDPNFDPKFSKPTKVPWPLALRVGEPFPAQLGRVPTPLSQKLPKSEPFLMTKKRLLSHTEILPYLSRVSTFQFFLPKGLCTIRIKFPLQKNRLVPFFRWLFFMAASMSHI